MDRNLNDSCLSMPVEKEKKKNKKRAHVLNLKNVLFDEQASASRLRFA